MSKFSPIALISLILVAGSVHAATFTVVNTNDSGAGSLRQAILDAVASPTAAHDHVVAFNIPGAGVHTIRPLSQLPAIKDLTIDGYTQPGSRANTLARGSDAVLTIEIDGSLAGAGTHGLVNEGAVPGAGVPNVAVRGLVINRFGGAGIRVTGPGGAGFPGFVNVRGCYIGTDASGTQARGNGVGIDFGTDAQGVIGEPGADFGGNVVPWPAYRNLISGNVGPGVKFDSADTNSPAFGTVRGAYIGTDAAGTAALGNGGDGVSIGSEGGVGSAGFGSFVYLLDNLVSGNMGDGIDSRGVGTQAVGNTIGAGSDGRALGNQGHGAHFHGNAAGALNAMFTPPGAVGPGVSDNAGAGVFVADSAVFDVSGRITGNLGLGVDLAPAGPSTNDATDADLGPNFGLNFPVITAAVSDGVSPTSRIQGTIHSKPSAQVQVLLYLNAACHASGFGEAGRFLSSVTVTTDASGDAAFDSQLTFPIDTQALPYVVAQSRRFAESSTPLPSMIEVSEYSACFRITGSTPLPTLGVSDASVSEGNSGTTNATFTVTLSAAASAAVSVGYATANGTATAGSDYTAISGTLNFAAGETSKTVIVAVSGDTAVEPNETFAVNLSAVSGATLADASGLGTILNDDTTPPPPLPTLTVADISVTEGNAATTATFRVTLSAAAASAVTVNYASADGTAMAGSDYTAASGTLTFAAGETSKTIIVTITGDTVVEPDETFTVNLSAVSGATLADASAQGTILNDDVAAPVLPALRIDNVSVQEGGDVRIVAATFTVSLSAASSIPVTVTVSTLNSAGVNVGTARDNGNRDYVRHTELLTFAPGVTSLPFVVTVINDRVAERPRIEEYTVFLRDAVGATIERTRGRGTIVDDDGPPPGSGGGGGALDAWLLAILTGLLLWNRRLAVGRHQTQGALGWTPAGRLKFLRR